MFCLRSKSGNIFTLSLCLQRKFSNSLNVAKVSQKPVILKQKKNIYSCAKKFCSTLPSSNVKGSEEIDYKLISNGNKELEHKLKIIVLEAEVMRQEGKPVPEISFITSDMWKEALGLETRSARRKYYEFLFKISKKKENRGIKKIEKKQQGEIAKEEYLKSVSEDEKNQTLRYDLQHNNIFLRFYESTMNQMYNNRLIQAMQFGQKIVIDCGYDQNMTKRENINCAKQLMLVFAENRYHDEPFDIHYCNLKPETDLEQAFHRHVPTMYEPSFPINAHEGSYLDLFPKNKLVYLTPHCREEMNEFDHDAIYIIGAIVDKINNEPLSLAKAKKEGIKMQKFPLDRYLQWGSGSGKSLTLNQCISIMLDVKSTGDWQHALRHVPRRKIVDMSMNNNIRNTTDKLRYDRNRREKSWKPTYSNLDSQSNKNDSVRYGRVNVKSLFDE